MGNCLPVEVSWGGSSQDNALKQIAKRTSKLKKEQYRIIDSNGATLVMRKGEEHEVQLTVGEKREMLLGNVSIHNHPNGGTFSPEDLSDFGYGAKAIVVSSNEGTYRLINNNFGKQSQYDGWKKMQEDYIKSTNHGQSLTDYRGQAREQIKKSKEAKAVQKYVNACLKAKNNGATKQQLDLIAEKQRKAQSSYSEKLRKTERMLEVKAYHNFLKQNANKYGFRYSYPKNVY